MHIERARGTIAGAVAFVVTLLSPAMESGIADAAVPDSAPLNIVGSWNGEVEVQPGVRLPLVVHIVAGEDGALTATVDSPAQGVTGIPVSDVIWDGTRLELSLPSIGASYEGILVDGERLKGNWRQGGMTLALVLARGEGTEPARPQHPEPPFPYRDLQVRFRNPDAEILLAGTLTIPEGAGPFPAVVLVTGSGPQDRDETLLGHKPFLVIADHLTKAGIAVLRYDDRGVADSEGDFASATSMDFAADAAAAVTFLRARSDIDADAIGIVGHSEGGLVAPLVATGRGGIPGKQVAFVVLLAGPGLNGGDILLLQSEAIARANGADDGMVDQILDFQHGMQAIVRDEANERRRRARIETFLREFVAAIPEGERPAQGIPPGGEEPWIQGQAAFITSEWFRTFLMYEPAPVLAELGISVLALFGGKDLQVPPDENLAAMEDAFARAPSNDVTLLVLPDLNHLFQTAGTGSPTEYAVIEETFAPVALDAMRDWILERFGGR